MLRRIQGPLSFESLPDLKRRKKHITSRIYNQLFFLYSDLSQVCHGFIHEDSLDLVTSNFGVIRCIIRHCTGCPGAKDPTTEPRVPRAAKMEVGHSVPKRVVKGKLPQFV